MQRFFSALNPVPAVQAVQLAIKHATAGQAGPVAVLFNRESLVGTVAADSCRASIPRLGICRLRRREQAHKAVAKAVAAIRAATKPVIILAGKSSSHKRVLRLRAFDAALHAARSQSSNQS